RGDLRFGRPRMPSPGIAQGESVAAAVEAGDLDPDQLAQHRVDRALARERAAEGGERLEHGRALRVGARARRGARLALRVLAQVPDLLVDLVDTERLDAVQDVAGLLPHVLAELPGDRVPPRLAGDEDEVAESSRRRQVRVRLRRVGVDDLFLGHGRPPAWCALVAGDYNAAAEGST